MMLAVFENQKQTSQIFKKPLQVAIFGFDQRTQQTLEIAFKNIGNNCATIVTSESAQAVIFNFDNLDSREMFLNFRKEHIGFPTIVISSKEIALRGAYVLTKPLRVAKFTNIFNMIQEQLAANPHNNETINPSNSDSHISTHETVQQAEQPHSQKQSRVTDVVKESNGKLSGTYPQNLVDKNTSQLQPDIYYAPKTHIQSIIHTAYKEALEKNIVIEVNLKVENDWGSITLFPGLKKVATDFSEQRLKYMCSTPLYCFETKVIRYDEAKTKKMEFVRSVDEQLVSFETFLWEVALWTSNGRLPEGINLNTPYRLRRWPNFTRLKTIPHSFSMAALFSQKPININLFSKVADISQDSVYSFFSCVYALDLLETSTCNDEAGDLLQRPAQQHPKRGLFERIVNKLKIK